MWFQILVCLVACLHASFGDTFPPGGVCPKPSPFVSLYSKLGLSDCKPGCADSSQCGGGKVCCEGGSCRTRCATPVKRGRCPDVAFSFFSFFDFTLCKRHCRSDFDCDGDKKCCFNGCGQTCQHPVTRKKMCPWNQGPDPKVLRKALSYSDANLLCQRPCSSDKDCPADQACCIAGSCGLVCQPLIPCPAVLCKKPIGDCPYGQKLDANGCPTLCQCFDPCESVKCGPGSHCQANQTPCAEKPCTNNFQVTCVTVCPLIKCSEPCPHGFLQDKDGCQTCTCANPCAQMSGGDPVPNSNCGRGGTPCEDGFQCVIDKTDRFAVCCRKCAPNLCKRYCRYGFKKDANGCETCDCVNPCGGPDDGSPIPGLYCGKGNDVCPWKTECVITEDDQFAVCCRKKCTRPTCATDEKCKYGRALDNAGCKTCTCNPDPCQDPGCDAGTSCTGYRRVKCTKYPCVPPFEPDCKPTCPDGSDPVNCLVDPCKDQTCDTWPDAECESNFCGGCNAVWKSFARVVDCTIPRCELPSETGACRAAIPRYFFNSKTYKCELFSYGGCGGNTNNFLTEEDCYKTCGHIH